MSTKRDRRRSRPAGDRAMQRATLMALIVGLVLDGLLILFAALRHDSPAVLGAVVGTALTLVIVVPSVTIAFTGKRMTPVTMAAAVLGSWAGKMLVVIIVLVLLKDVDEVSKRWIGQALLVGALSAVAVEAVLLIRSRQPLDVVPAGEVDDLQDQP